MNHKIKNEVYKALKDKRKFEEFEKQVIFEALRSLGSECGLDMMALAKYRWRDNELKTLIRTHIRELTAKVKEKDKTLKQLRKELEKRAQLLFDFVSKMDENGGDKK